MATTCPAVDVTAVVVSYNGRRLLGRCLRSITSCGTTVEVVVVDNGSADRSPELVRRWFPAASVIETGANVGFAAAVNRGASQAGGRYVLLVNPDAVLHPGCIDELVAFADRHPQHGIYGGRILTPAGDLDPRSCFGLPTPWSAFCFGSGLSSALRGSRRFDPEALGGWGRDTVREVGVISGALMLVERTLWDRLGGFDDAYFMYGEDVDLCDRARGLGARPVVVPSARAVHVVGASSTPVAKAVMLFTGKATYLRRRWTGPARWWGIAMLQLGVGLRALLASRSPGDRAAVWPALWAARSRWVRGYDRSRGQEVAWSAP